MKARQWRCAAFGAVLLAMGVGACTNPVSPAAHVRPDSFVILMGDDTLVSGDRMTASGTLELAPGAVLAAIRVEFLSGGEVRAPGESYFLEVAISPAGVIAFEPAAPGAFTGTLRALASGSASLRVRLMHGRVGSVRAHSDFDGASVPVVVSSGA